MVFGGFLHLLQVTELLDNLCKWLVNRFDPYLVTLYISPDKGLRLYQRICISHWHSPLVEGRLRSFIAKIQKMPNTTKSLMYGGKTRICKMGPLSLSQMPQYILSQTDAGESFKRNFMLCMASFFFNGSKNVHCAPYFAKNVANIEDIAIIDWCQYTIDRLCEYVKKRVSNFDGLILFLMVYSLYSIKISCFQ